MKLFIFKYIVYPFAKKVWRFVNKIHRFTSKFAFWSFHTYRKYEDK